MSTRSKKRFRPKRLKRQHLPCVPSVPSVSAVSSVLLNPGLASFRHIAESKGPSDVIAYCQIRVALAFQQGSHGSIMDSGQARYWFECAARHNEFAKSYMPFFAETKTEKSLLCHYKNLISDSKVPNKGKAIPEYGLALLLNCNASITGKTESMVLANKHLESSASSGFLCAQFRLCCSEPEAKNQVHCLEKLKHTMDPEVLFALGCGQIYIGAEELGFATLSESAQMGFSPAQLRVAEILLTPDFKWCPNSTNAKLKAIGEIVLDHLNRAASQGHPRALLLLKRHFSILS